MVVGVAILLTLGVIGSFALVGRSLRAELSAPTSARVGDPITFTMHVCSNSLLPLTKDDGKPHWRILNEADDVVADSSHYVYTLELITRTWRPRECRQVVTMDWDQRQWNRPHGVKPDIRGEPALGPQVPDGTYRMEASWGSAGRASIEFQIVR